MAKDKDKKKKEKDVVATTSLFPDTPTKTPFIFWLMGCGAKIAALCYIAWLAYDIRMYAIRDFGLVIHEFDPWFNFRATQYLLDNGWEKFFHWFDYMSWYPLGRSVGTTIYPGMQISSVVIHSMLESVGAPMSINDICCYVPCWFGVSATMLIGLLAREVSGSDNAGVMAALVMSIIPAHTMRSVGGGYDNESVAMTTFGLTFFTWCRAVRTEKSWPMGVAAGLAYVYMVATWGGYVFVLNVIAIHTTALFLLGRHTPSLYRAYSLFYIIGTFGATRVPVVGLAPFKSLEQMPALLVFGGLQLLAICDVIAKARYPKGPTFAQLMAIRVQVVTAACGVAAMICYFLFDAGFFQPLGARTRGLFVKHTRTGNPLVDSVAEHQPANKDAYWHYMQGACYLAPIGAVVCVLRRSNAAIFALCYAGTAYFFSMKMMRLIILMGPIASVLSGVALGFAVDFFLAPILRTLGWSDIDGGLPWSNSTTSFPTSIPNNDKSDSKIAQKFAEAWDMFTNAIYKMYDMMPVRLVRIAVVIGLAMQYKDYPKEFYDVSHSMAQGMSSPQIMFKGQLNDGSSIIVDDYRQAYFWLRDNTPEDARVMAWWDYGYQITGIGNRTSIADGNTWNHEHIATLGKMLTAPVKDAHRNIRHLADYVLVWSGGGGDDLAKSPHLARIGNSVFPGTCKNDPTCRLFGFDQQGRPTPMMRDSLLYNLVANRQRPGAAVDPNRFQEVHQTKYGKVRIYKVMSVSQKSKKWVADPANRICDAPGSWYCVGQYPPALQEFISQRKAFAQLEDFNTKKKKTDKEKQDAEDYNREYMARMAGKAESTEGGSRNKPAASSGKGWADSDATTKMWELIHSNDMAAVEAWLKSEPTAALMRSSDGRGPLWWAYEHNRRDMAKLFKANGAKDSDTDAKGQKAVDLKKKRKSKASKKQ